MSIPETCLRYDSYFPKKIYFSCFDEGPLKIMKNAFYSILKTLFVLKVFKILSLPFGHIEKTA